MATSKRTSEKELKEAKKGEQRSSAAPLPYQPRDPVHYRPGIAMVGCGGITSWHLTAYRNAGYNVVVLCDIDRKRAQQRRDEFYPQAYVTEDIHMALARDDVEVVDITTHPQHRRPLVEAALAAGKHVLSQKPFVTDLDEVERLADLADEQGVKLAVNQNARWAPHFSYIREAVRAGLLGHVNSINCDVHWDHSWAKGTPFESIRHLILYDFAIHWFDMLCAVMEGVSPTRVHAAMTRTASQEIAPALMAQASVMYPSSQATLVFDGHTQFGRLDRTYVAGSKGTICSSGLDNDDQHLEMSTAEGVACPQLKGSWFPDGFHGTMGELLCAIEEEREPSHSARNNLQSLALCFAAVASAERGEPVVPGSVRKMPEG